MTAGAPVAHQPIVTRFDPEATLSVARVEILPSASDTLSRTRTDVSHLSFVTLHNMKPRCRLTNLSAALAREPDQGGALSNLTFIKDGGDRKQMLRSMLESQEFKNLQ